MRKLIFPIILALLISGCISPEKPETTTFEVTPTISTTSISESDLLLNERAISAKNVSLCEKISDVNLRVSCSSDLSLNEKAIAAKDVNICGEVSDKNLRESCIAAIAKEVKNFAMCGPLSIADKCIYDVGVAAKDVNICGEVSDKNLRESCIAAIAKE